MLTDVCENFIEITTELEFEKFQESQQNWSKPKIKEIYELIFQCAKKVALSEQTQASINECINGPLSNELLVAHGEKTKKLNPSLSFVPTITINGVSTRHYKHVSSKRDSINNESWFNHRSFNPGFSPSVAGEYKGDTDQGTEQFL